MILLSRLIKHSFSYEPAEINKKRIELKPIYFKDRDQDDEHEISLEQQSQELLQVAQLKAEQMIQQAENEAAKLMEEINTQKNQWLIEKDELKKAAYEEGLQQGLEDGRKMGHAEYVQLIDEAKHVVATSKEAFNDHLESAEHVILALAIESAEKIIQAILQEDEKKFLPLVKSAVKEAKEFKEIHVHVHPSKYEMIIADKDEIEAILPTHVQCYIYPNEELEQFGCRIESDYGRIDASIGSQLIELKKQLSNLLNGES